MHYATIRDRFKVIQGGASSTTSRAGARPLQVVAAEDLTTVKPAPLDETGFNQMVMHLHLDSLGVTVAQALDEFSELYYSPDSSALNRGHAIERAMVGAGLRICSANKRLELDRPVFLTLTNPARMRNTWPHLANAKVERFEGCTLG